MIETIVLGGGCFWCVEAVFQTLAGVKHLTSGYAGGQVINPTYEQVCTGHTGHAEVVKLEYDTQAVSLEVVLQLFFATHDPTTLNRQGADVGTQYRSVIFYRDEVQRQTSLRVIEQVQQAWRAPMVTQILPLGVFYAAENYHQNYFRTHPDQGFCQMVVRKKVEKALDFLQGERDK